MLGLAMTILFPSLAIATAWSAAGASLLASLGSAAMEFGRPQWATHLPQQLVSQVLALAVLVAVGIAAHLFVERPALRIVRHLAQPKTAQLAPVSGHRMRERSATHRFWNRQN